MSDDRHEPSRESHREWRWLKGFLIGALISWAVVSLVHWVVWYGQLRYRAEVTFEVRPLQFGGEGPIATAFSPELVHAEELDIATEMEVIRSPAILASAAESLKLHEQWNCDTQAAALRLARKIELERVNHSRLLRLRVTDSDSQQAVEVADAIVNRYRMHRMKLWMDRHNRDRDTLESQLREYRERVEDARLKKLAVEERYGIIGETFSILRENQVRSAEAVRLARERLAGVPEVPAEERQRIEELRRLHETAREEVMDMQKRRGDYDDVRRMYELTSTLYNQMQETYARAHVMLKMPLNPIVIHGPAQFPTTQHVPDWRIGAIRAAREDWWIILLGGLVGAGICRYWPAGRPPVDASTRPSSSSSSPEETPRDPKGEW